MTRNISTIVLAISMAMMGAFLALLMKDSQEPMPNITQERSAQENITIPVNNAPTVNTSYLPQLNDIETRLATLEAENLQLRTDLNAMSMWVSAIDLSVKAGNVDNSGGAESTNTKRISGQDIRQAFMVEQVNERHEQIWKNFAPYLDKDVRSRLDEFAKEHELELAGLRRSMWRASPEKREEINLEIASKESSFREKLTSELGYEATQLYEDYVKTIPVREKVASFERRSAKTLDDGIREQLVTTLVNVQSQVDWVGPESGVSPRSLSEEQRQQIIEKTKQLNEAYLKSTQYVLDEEAQAVFKQSLDRDVERLQSGPGGGRGGGR